MNIKAPADGGLMLARALLLGVLVTMLVSTSVGISLEFASYIAFVALPEPRRRLRQALRYPVVIGLLPFAAAVVAATFYGPASWYDAVGPLIGWRRVLLLPLAAAVFDDAASKRLACKVMVIACLAGALVSFVTAWGSITFGSRLEPGIVFHNYAAQGLSLSVAMIICIAALLRPDAFAGDRLLGDRRIMAMSIVVLIIDTAFILKGRSGYVSVIVMAVTVVTFLVRGSWRVKALTSLGVLICVGVVLFASAHVRGRVAQALYEIETVDQAPVATSLGMRVTFWRNTVRMIRDHPILGVGTGGFQYGYRPYVQGVSGWRGEETGDPHNQFLKILGEQGLVGFAALLFFVFWSLTCPAPAPYRQIGAAILIGWCATSLANSHFSTFVEGRLLFFWLGAMLADRAQLDGVTTSGQV